MKTTELLDISDLVSGWYRPASVDVDVQEPVETSYHGADECSTGIDPDTVPDGLSIEAAVEAIDAKSL